MHPAFRGVGLSLPDPRAPTCVAPELPCWLVEGRGSCAQAPEEGGS